MNKSNKLIYFYGIASIVGGTLGFLFPSPTLWMLLTILIPPCTLIFLRQLSLTQAVILCGAMATVSIVTTGSLGVGLIFALLWYFGPLILKILTERTPNLYPVLLYGSSIFLGLFILFVIFIVKEYYGVWDIRALYRETAEMISESFTLSLKTMKEILPPDQYKQTKTLISTVLQESDLLVFQVWSSILLMLATLYFWTLKTAQRWSKTLEKRILSAPLPLFSVPRDVTIAYISLYVISAFLPNEYYYAASLACTLLGYLFVLAAIGFINTLLLKKSAAVRTVVSILAFLLSMSGGTVYIILTILGIFICLTRRIIITKNKENTK